ncbi:MAG: endonuclease III [Defluviitaleaceae bacterium]|nr:endonuclease III [Defluviitaleaceae bacterium]MCL2262249.1 endonuclease III [Defluviitaleaceae bacterium]
MNIGEILKIFDELYPFDGKCFLNYQTPWQLLFATILSAQCTDDCVNMVTEKLFVQFPTLQDFANADIHELEKAVFQTGFYRNKARHLQGSAMKLLKHHGGEVPSDISLLTALPGVGRKTANVVRGHIFKIPSIVVDTHVKRVSNRLGLVRQTCPVKIEHELMEILPQSHWISYNQQAITHGRQVCFARKPKCDICALKIQCFSIDGHAKT